MNLNTLLDLAIMIFAGMFCGRMAKHVHLPNVTGYLVAGLLIGPSVFGLLSEDFLTTINIISDVALGFIAFSIGNEFKMSYFKRVGVAPIVIACLESLFAVVFVVLGLLIAGQPLPFSLVLGAIAAATAPAATIMVIKQYKAKGPVVDLLLPIVALDDAVGLIVFAVSFGMAKTFSSGAALSVVSVLVSPLLEVIASLALGSLLGLAYTYVERFFHSRSKRLCVAITFVILAVSLSMMEFTIPGTEIEVGFSSLLVCMMLGTIFCNICPSSEELMAKTDRWTAPLFVLFFVISGAELDLSVFSDVTCVLIGLVYILFRSLGKITGAGISSKFMKCEPVVQKWLGLTLLPQAGVALGMSITVAELGAEGAIIRSIVLFSVLIYELVGPMLTKIALTKAGEIHPKEETPAPAAK